MALSSECNSSGLLQATDGNFYGTSHDGGLYGIGTVFKMTPDGNVTVLCSMSVPVGDPLSHPVAELIKDCESWRSRDRSSTVAVLLS